MRNIPLFEVKNKLSFFVHLAEQGESIGITRHGKTSAVLVSADSQETLTSSYTKSPFYLAYLNFRKKLDFDSFTEEEWKNTFDIKRNQTVVRHPEDFE